MAQRYTSLEFPVAELAYSPCAPGTLSKRACAAVRATRGRGVKFVKQPLSVLLATGAFALAFAGNANAQYAYIANGSDNTVSVIDTTTNAVTATVKVGSGPNGVAVNPAGTYVYVGNSDNTVSVIDTATNAVAATVSVPGGPFVGVAVNPAGTHVYVTNGTSETVAVIDTATNAITATVGVGRGTYGVAVNPAGTRVYVANVDDGNVSVIDTATNTVTATVNLNAYPISSTPVGVAIDPSGTHLYVSGGATSPATGGAPLGTVWVIDTATNTITTSVRVAGNGASGIAVDPSGAHLYVAADGVSVIDTATNTVAARVVVGDAPWGLAMNPSGTRVYVENTDYGGTFVDTVSVIDTATNSVTAAVRFGSSPSSFGQFIGVPPVPSVNAGGIVNNASAAANMPVAPGSLVSVYGTFPVSAGQANVTPWPTTLSGLSMQFNGVQAPLVFASATQANVQVPWELAGQTQASVTVSVGKATSTTQTVNLASFAPGVFTMNAQGQGAVVDALTGELIAPSNPAKAGSTYISVYCTGLGPVTNRPATGFAASATVLSQTIMPATVTIGGVPASVIFSGLAPTFVGLYQVNVQVPAAVPYGNAVPLVVAIGGATANTVTIAVQAGS
jgi:uncharacterized protein (TIGR03437 family)